MLLLQQQASKRKQTKVVILRKHRREANDSPPANNKADWRYRQMGSLGANGKDTVYQVHETENRSGRVAKHATDWLLVSPADSSHYSEFLHVREKRPPVVQGGEKARRGKTCRSERFTSSHFAVSISRYLRRFPCISSLVIIVPQMEFADKSLPCKEVLSSSDTTLA